jgi:ubiquinone/menaquinone biosynthesis C-methylase UbiE
MGRADADRNYWERHSQSYDRSLRVLNRNIPRLCELAMAAVKDAVHVLEVAAGTGVVTTAIAGSARQIVATDYSEAMVRTLNARVRAAGLDNVQCERADLLALPYEAASFDAVVAANVLHLVPDLSGAIAALRRVLAPGGRLVVPTFCHDETLLAAVTSRVIALTKFPGHRRFTVESLRKSLAAHGFRVLHQETLGGLIPIGYVDGVFE